METINQKRKDLLRLSIVAIVASTLFDITDIFSTIPFSNTWLNTHLFLKDLMIVGFSLGFFLQTNYEDLQIKALTYMFVVWRVIVAIFNLSGYYEPKIIIFLYLIYFFWLFRIFMIKEIPLDYTGKSPQRNINSYNIFIPVHTFRGLLKCLFLPLSDPRYETTILVDGESMYYVKNKLFFKVKKDEEIINALVKDKRAKVKIKPASPKKMREINKLNFKRSILGLRDCRRLQL